MNNNKPLRHFYQVLRSDVEYEAIGVTAWRSSEAKNLAILMW